MEPSSLKAFLLKHWVIVAAVLSVAALALCPLGVREALLLQRNALLRGEFWRLWTGHWVHFGSSHLLWDLSSFAAAGLWLGALGARRVNWLVLAVVAPLLGGGLLVVERQLEIYGGLSGLVCAQCAALAVLLWKGNRRAVALMLAAVLLAKLCLDFFQGQALFARFEAEEIRTVPWAHLLGICLGLPLGWLVSGKRQDE